ncbi:MAG: TPM domain-containing protein [Gammaproteobacteria bacterium]|nr:TPM domain-containing protein [Gammaproteobacteria bacterium]
MFQWRTDYGVAHSVPALRHAAVLTQWSLALLAILALVSTQVVAQDAPDFPDLTGRVVDTAGLLSAAEASSLAEQLEQHETDTSNQIVVVTIQDLQGYEIADYANRLGRHWGIGQAELDNGVLLVVAPSERKVRIEVGYGLEGALPDATSADIIRRQILPSFRESEFATGVSKGVDSIISAIAGEYKPQPEKSRNKLSGALALPFIGFIAATQLLSAFGRRELGRELGHSAFPAGFAGIFTAAVTGNVWFGIAATAVLFCLLFFFVKPGSRSVGNRSTGTADQRQESTVHHRSGGRGFGGGGGSFGGGGASGSW